MSTEQPPAKPREFWIRQYSQDGGMYSDVRVMKPSDTDADTGLPPDIVLNSHDCVNYLEVVHVIERSAYDQLQQELAFVKTQWKQTSDLLEQERNRLTEELADVRKELDGLITEYNFQLKMTRQFKEANEATANERDQALAQAAALAGALEKVQSIVVEDECEECGTFKGVRYEVKPAVEALAAYTAWRKGRE